MKYRIICPEWNTMASGTCIPVIVRDDFDTYEEAEAWELENCTDFTI